MKAASWSDLPPELLGLILKRLPSLPDHVRSRAVCRPWRSNARLQSLAPPTPWLTLLDGTFLSIPDGEIIRVPVPSDASCCGSVDNWLFLMRNDGECSLMNPFSKATLDLPKLATVWRLDQFNARLRFNPVFYKLVVPSPLDLSPNSFVTVLISDDGTFRTVCICQPPIATDLSRGRYGELTFYLEEIEFFDGNLYGIDSFLKLLIFEISDCPGSKPKIASVKCIIDPAGHLRRCPDNVSADYVFSNRLYLVNCDGRLLIVSRWFRDMAPDRPTSHDFLQHFRTVAFQVFEADLSTKPGQWKIVNKLGGQALFVGQHCSKSFPAGECNGMKEDCIYFMCYYAEPHCTADPLRDSGVCNITNGLITPLLLSETATVPLHLGGQWRPVWFFPAEPM